MFRLLVDVSDTVYADLRRMAAVETATDAEDFVAFTARVGFDVSRLRYGTAVVAEQFPAVLGALWRYYERVEAAQEERPGSTSPTLDLEMPHRFRPILTTPFSLADLYAESPALTPGPGDAASRASTVLVPETQPEVVVLDDIPQPPFTQPDPLFEPLSAQPEPPRERTPSPPPTRPNVRRRLWNPPRNQRRREN